ncbi:Yip1 family protein [Proteiniborus sp. MB09-C3]|uniref:Yip1 family protein n=1 Tax=Proteiniborus sp. MB09-C3 TaxID=3050072 RepID=UPI002554629F|nr:Yip1 family protein [Proteiniborus sp. MB09-C3]WIV11992.1 Yip1 family protein [Proteiniborus sp. MB09-C3]
MAENINQNQNEVNEVKPFSWWERLKYIFIRPSKVFENLKDYPKVLFPMLVILLGILATYLPRIGTMKEAIIQQFAMSGMEAPEGLITAQVYTGIIFAVILIVIVWLVKSALINAFSGFVNGTGTFKQAFSVIAHSYFPVLLGSIIIAIISFITKQNNILTSLAVFLPDSQAGTFLHTLLASLDVFVIWYQILAIIGISKVYSISKKSSAILVLGTWIVFILISSGLGVLGMKAAGQI